MLRRFWLFNLWHRGFDIFLTPALWPSFLVPRHCGLRFWYLGIMAFISCTLAPWPLALPIEHDCQNILWHFLAMSLVINFSIAIWRKPLFIGALCCPSFIIGLLIYFANCKFAITVLQCKGFTLIFIIDESIPFYLRTSVYATILRILRWYLRLKNINHLCNKKHTWPVKI